jgi:hypothetical protein
MGKVPTTLRLALAQIVVENLFAALLAIRDNAGVTMILAEQKVDLALAFAGDALVLAGVRDSTVLRADLYAVAALAGAAVVVIGAALRLPSTAVTKAGGSSSCSCRPRSASRLPALPPTPVATPDAGELVSCGSLPATDRSGTTLKKGAGNRANSPVALQISFILR